MNELQSLSHIFSHKLFRIPDYQRGYAWQDTQLQDFWEDLINLQQDKYHYTGLLSLKVLNKTESALLDNEDQWLLNSGYKAYHIVDGQQRLTTFVILLNEIVTFVRSLSENKGKTDDSIYIGCDSLKDISAQYICKVMPPAGLVTTFLFGYENDNPSAEYLKYKIFGQRFGGTLKETYYTKNLKRAKEFFSCAIREYYDKLKVDGISSLFQKLTQKLMFNIHEIEDDYDVFVAFETMNNRGKKLTNLELLKNRLIYLTTLYKEEDLDKANEEALRKTINNAWKEVYYQLGRNEKLPLSDDEYLRSHWIMYFSYSRKKGDDYIRYLLRKFSNKSIFEDVYSSVENENELSELEEENDDETAEEEIDTVSGEYLKPTDIADYVNSLNEMASYWYYTFFPEESNAITDEEKLWIGRLNRIGIGYFRPIIAVSLLPILNFTTLERINFYKAVERFIFINFRLAMYQSSYRSSEYYRMTREIYMDGKTLQSATDDLNMITEQNAPDALKVFTAKMNQRFISADGFYSWRDLKYFLYEYEYSLAEKYKVAKIDWADLSKVVKDHVSIEHIFPQTPTKHYWKNHFRQFSEEEKRILAGSLGNLLPLSKSINSKLQNDSFDEKKQRGYINGSHSEIEVSREAEWTAEQIYNRGMMLLDYMALRWGFTFENQEQKDELLHIAFAHDGRAIPAEVVPITPIDDAPVITSSNKSIREQYWEYALPAIRDAQGGEGHPYSNVNASDSHSKDGFFGIPGIHLYTSLSLKPHRCTVGFWIDTGDRDTSKRIFDCLFAHKDKIQSQITLPIKWDRKEGKRASSIDIVLEGVDYLNTEDWAKIRDFQATKLKEIADAGFYPYENEIRNL